MIAIGSSAPSALVIGTTANASAAAAALRRAGVVTETRWRGALKKHLAATGAEIVVIADGDRFAVRDMILREQRDTSLATLNEDLADAFDGYLLDPREPEVDRTEASARLSAA